MTATSVLLHVARHILVQPLLSLTDDASDFFNQLVVAMCDAWKTGIHWDDAESLQSAMVGAHIAPPASEGGRAGRRRS